MSNHSNLKTYPFASGPSGHLIKLYLYQRENPGRTPVLLLHGASARHETFMIGGSQSLMAYLHEEGFEPWLLDWRGSGKVVDEALSNGTLKEQRDYFDFDYSAKYDIPGALKLIRHFRPDAKQIGAVGHCLGAGTLAQAIADPAVDLPSLTHVVLLTLGLFYEPPLDSRLKTQDHLLERLMREPEPVLAIDPWAIDPRGKARWPKELEEMYQNWPNPLRPHPGEGLIPVHELCDRLSFMYGTPYFEKNLVPEVHHSETWTIRFESGINEPSVGSIITGKESKATGTLEYSPTLTSGSWKDKDAKGVLVLKKEEGKFEPDEKLHVEGEFATAISPAVEGELPRQFGAIPLRMYLHGARNVRRGWAAKYDDPNDNVELLQHQERFARLGGVTLITGEKNQLWHRDSIDRMYEWLMRGTPMRNLKKWVFRDYGHQDLLWGRNAGEEVFPMILEGLQRGVQTKLHRKMAK